MPRPSVPVPRRQAIDEGLAEYYENRFPAEDDVHVPEAENGTLDMLYHMDMQAAQYEAHLGHSKPHDPNTCYQCHFLRPCNDEGHDRSRCAECIKEDAREIALEEESRRSFPPPLEYLDLLDRVPDEELLEALGYGRGRIVDEIDNFASIDDPFGPPRPHGIQRFAANPDS